MTIGQSSAEEGRSGQILFAARVECSAITPAAAPAGGASATHLQTPADCTVNKPALQFTPPPPAPRERMPESTAFAATGVLIRRLPKIRPDDAPVRFTFPRLHTLFLGGVCMTRNPRPGSPNNFTFSARVAARRGKRTLQPRVFDLVLQIRPSLSQPPRRPSHACKLVTCTRIDLLHIERAGRIPRVCKTERETPFA